MTDLEMMETTEKEPSLEGATSEELARAIYDILDNKKARDLMMRAPSKVSEEQLKDVHIELENDV